MRWLLLMLLVMLGLQAVAQQQDSKVIAVAHLAVDLVEETDVVYSNGFATDIPLWECDLSNPNYQIAEINTTAPRFSWRIESKKNKVYQSKYRILVASQPGLLHEGHADMWDSGIVPDSCSTGILYRGTPLMPGERYFFTVRIYDSKKRCSPYAPFKCFVVSPEPDDVCASLPLQKQEQFPKLITHPNRTLMLDFGKDAFSQIKFHFSNVTPHQPVTVRLGEMADSNGVCARPGGSRRYSVYHFTLDSVRDYYTIDIRKDKRNTNPNASENGVSPVLMPNYIGEVFPFRYCQIEGYNGAFLYRDAVRTSVSYPFDDNAAAFSCSDTVLNQIWNLCRYSMKATSFCGKFVDGDRERIPYESSALVNQLSYYAADSHFSIARSTLEHLLGFPNSSTEGIMQTLFIAWYDYLYTGDDFILKKYYHQLKDRTLMFLRRNDGLLHTGNNITDLEYLQKVNFRGRQISDYIDFPDGETDGYERGECNSVVNEFHYKALMLLANIATAIGNRFDAENYQDMARQTLRSVNSMMTDSCGVYTDALSSNHRSLHANMLALAFDMVDYNRMDSVRSFVKSRGMACSVYGAQFLLDAVYNSGMYDYGYKLLTDTCKRGWYNMMRSGSTITTEAWDKEFNPGHGWNSACGASAMNIIVRKLMGVEPLSAGFATVSIAPKTSGLHHAELSVPTPRGTINVKIENSGKKYSIHLYIPPNCRARVQMPFSGKYVWVESGKSHLSEPIVR
ncbi:MAG: alpha-L-rhamnosidase [Bacteroidales bacterium]|nr:alpha-L-rhamnosidase [Bacteroidales bacterium]